MLVDQESTTVDDGACLYRSGLYSSGDTFKHWWQRKVVWFWDDNLTIKRDFIKKLLEEMVPLKRWWLTQASMDIAKDAELLDFMKASGCIGIFFGIESFGDESLKDAHKQQNKVRWG